MTKLNKLDFLLTHLWGGGGGGGGAGSKETQTL